jgi:hypothetical protein
MTSSTARAKKGGGRQKWGGDFLLPAARRHRSAGEQILLQTAYHRFGAEHFKAIDMCLCRPNYAIYEVEQCLVGMGALRCAHIAD